MESHSLAYPELDSPVLLPSSTCGYEIQAC